MNQRYIQHFDQYVQWLGEYMQLNFRINHGGGIIRLLPTDVGT